MLFRTFALALLPLTLGCTDPQPVHDGGEPNGEVVAPDLEPPPLEPGRISREDVMAIAREEEETTRAIQRLDKIRFGFALDAKALKWFGEQGLDPNVLDYLNKRSKVGDDWDALRGDVDPSAPE